MESSTFCSILRFRPSPKNRLCVSATKHLYCAMPKCILKLSQLLFSRCCLCSQMLKLKRYLVLRFHCRNYLLYELTDSIENNETTLGIFIDLAKAFDAVNHSIVLSKLYHYGIRGTPHRWFISYLSKRTQYVYVSNIQSDCLSITCGVPQRSILGPFLFLCIKYSYIYNVCRWHKYFYKRKKLSDITASVNKELTKVNTCTWFCANLLSLNVKKTNYISFGHKQIPDIDIFINSEKINRVYETKFLGVIIQHNVKWHAHSYLIKNKISKTIGIMNKVKHILSTSHLQLLYQTLIEPYLTYCSIIWASPEKTPSLNHYISSKNEQLGS